MILLWERAPYGFPEWIGLPLWLLCLVLPVLAIGIYFGIHWERRREKKRRLL
jgi:hypothetical protein